MRTVIHSTSLAASRVLTDDGHTGATYEIGGPLWTAADLARTVSEVSRTPVAHHAVQADDLGPAGFVRSTVE